MNLSHFLVFNLSLPAFGMAKGLSIYSEYRRLERIVSGSRQSVLELQTKKLRRLVAHAAAHVPYYQNLMAECGVAPEDVQGLEDLAKLPVLRREDIQEHADAMVSDTADMSKCYKGSSSGSTGAPVMYLRDKAGSSASQAALYFGWSLAGWRFGDPFLTVWGNVTTVKNDWARPSSKVKSLLFREVKAPAFGMSDPGKLDELYEICRTGRFSFVQGYTNAIHAFAEYLIARGISLPGIRGVLTTAENLQHHQRIAITQALGPVFDFYGCGEINAIAYQCREGRYHIMDPHVVLEYGDEADDQGNCELFITDLDNCSMPLIRYANGDMGRPGTGGTCGCGLPLGILAAVSGRTADVIRTPEGGILSVPSFLGSRLLKELPDLVRYRADLTAPNALVVYLQFRGNPEESAEQRIKQALNEYIPSSMQWSIHFVDSIQPETNGKYKLMVDRTKDAYK